MKIRKFSELRAPIVADPIRVDRLHKLERFVKRIHEVYQMNSEVHND